MEVEEDDEKFKVIKMEIEEEEDKDISKLIKSNQTIKIKAEAGINNLTNPRWSVLGVMDEVIIVLNATLNCLMIKKKNSGQILQKIKKLKLC